MKTQRKINLFGRELEFYNDELLKVAKMALNMGYKVHTFNPSGRYINQIFVDNGKTFGSISQCYSGVSYSTCHKSINGSGNGSGFVIHPDPMLANEELINDCFITVPNWAENELNKIKKQTWEEYLGGERILNYSEIKNL